MLTNLACIVWTIVPFKSFNLFFYIHCEFNLNLTTIILEVSVWETIFVVRYLKKKKVKNCCLFYSS